MPDDFEKALMKNKSGKQNFEAFSPSSKKIILSWIYGAKQPATRSKRILESVKLAAENIKANHYGRRPDGDLTETLNLFNQTSSS